MQAPPFDSVAQEKPIILVVEDNPVERQLVAKILRNADFEVIGVDCGEVVTDTVITYQPDLILLDALLPDIDGFDVCEQLRGHAAGVHIPIIMLTGLDDVGSINRAYESGATDFFTKPINHSLLVYRIRYLLRARLIMDQLRLNEQSLAGAQRVAKLGHWELDIDKNRLQVSDEIYQLYQFERSELIPSFDILTSRCHPDDKVYLEEALINAIRELAEIRIEHRIILDDASVRYVEIHTSLTNEAGKYNAHIFGISVDITERKESEREILSLAYCDRLTLLPNRSLLELYLEQAIPGSHVQGEAVAVLVIDLDLFNRVNNSMGHGAGDAILTQLTERLLALMDCPSSGPYLDRLSLSKDALLVGSGNEFVARLAADTFIVVLNRVNRSGDAVEQASKNIIDSFHQPFSYRGQELFVTASLGVAYSESGSTSAEGLLQQADLALHEAKTDGRNTVREYSGDLVRKVSTHLSIQSDIRKALHNNEFQLFYQPKISVHDGSIKGLEALVRWFHPEKGMISPEQFITIAEETGQIVEVGKWVMETACLQNKYWCDQNLLDVRVAVNVSARQFKQGGLDEMVANVLRDTGLNAKNLELEMTEGVLMEGAEIEDMIASLRRTGVSISLDDFGTGYSSLSYIHRFPIDTIKIDRCFVQDITMGSDKAAIVSAVSDLSHGLKFNVVAEGVETRDELEVIKALRCDEVQGYYYCPPISAKDMTQWVLNH